MSKNEAFCIDSTKSANRSKNISFAEANHDGRVETRNKNGEMVAHYFMGIPDECIPTSLKVLRGATWGAAVILNAATVDIFEKPLSNIFESLNEKINNEIFDHETKCYDKHFHK